MSGETKRPHAKMRILGEETVRKGEPSEDPEEMNPYWLDEDPVEHPNPELGCVRLNRCCRSGPGWFAPGQVEQAAAFLGMEPDAFVRQYVVIDGMEIEGERVEVFMPVKLGRDGQPLSPPARRVDNLYHMLRSPCVFFDGQGCRIYPHRPVECQRYVCTNLPEDNLSHHEIALMWRDQKPPDS